MSAQIPNCPKNCTAAHNFSQAMALLGVGRTKFYELINGETLQVLKTAYGRRIKHSEIDSYLESCANNRIPANTGEQVRTKV